MVESVHPDQGNVGTEPPGDENLLGSSETVESVRPDQGNDAPESQEDEVPPGSTKDIGASETVIDTVAEFIDLYSGAALNTIEAEAVTARARTQIVILTGAVDSGKTTVITSIFEELNKGIFAGFEFAGSRSLLGFEEICHLNRLVSGAAQPNTPRTSLSAEPHYYHLALKSVNQPSVKQNILLSAMSGELFRMAMDLREDAAKLTFLHRADTIVVLVDGDRLATPEARMGAQADASNILEGLLDANMVSESSNVEIVFSKLDRILVSGEAAQRFLKSTKDKYEKRFRSRIPNLSMREIAARVAPNQEAVEDTIGLEEAFIAWTSTTHTPSKDDLLEQLTTSYNDREFGKFGLRQLSRSVRDS